MEFVETFRSVVAPSECDHLGHMNVSGYFTACSDAVIAIQSSFGLPPSDLRDGRKLSFAVVRAESDFKLEVKAGEAIYMQTGLEEIGNKSIVFRHRLKRSEDDVVVFETIFRCVLLDLEHRRAAVIPDDVRSKAEALLNADDIE